MNQPQKKLYLLINIDNDGPSYDINLGHVILANDEDEARSMANKYYADEGEIWKDSEKTTCEEINLEGESTFILTSFNAG